MEKKPVSLKRQTIYAFIPYVNIWAFYRIQKLRKFILLAIAVGLAFYPIQRIMFFDMDVSNMTNPFEIYSEPLFIMYVIAMHGSMYAVLVYFIRRWSKQWNSHFQSENS